MMAATGLAESAGGANQCAAIEVGEREIIPLAPLFRPFVRRLPAQFACYGAPLAA